MQRGPERSLFMLVTDPKALIIISNIFCLIQSGGSSLKALIMNYVKSKLTHEKQLFPQKKPPSSHTHTHTQFESAAKSQEGCVVWDHFSLLHWSNAFQSSVKNPKWGLFSPRWNVGFENQRNSEDQILQKVRKTVRKKWHLPNSNMDSFHRIFSVLEAFYLNTTNQ